MPLLCPRSLRGPYHYASPSALVRVRAARYSFFLGVLLGRVVRDSMFLGLFCLRCGKRSPAPIRSPVRPSANPPTCLAFLACSSSCQASPSLLSALRDVLVPIFLLSMVIALVYIVAVFSMGVYRNIRRSQLSVWTALWFLLPIRIHLCRSPEWFAIRCTYYYPAHRIVYGGFLSDARRRR